MMSWSELPLLLMIIAFVIIGLYVYKHESGVSAVFKRLRSFGDFQYSGRDFPGLHGSFNGREFNCYYENIESKPASFLFTVFTGLRMKMEIDANLVLKLGLRRNVAFTGEVKRESFHDRYLPWDLLDPDVVLAMNNIRSSRDFEHFVKLSIEVDAMKYYHHLTGMSKEYLNNMMFLLDRFAERIERMESMFRIKGF